MLARFQQTPTTTTDQEHERDGVLGARPQSHKCDRELRDRWRDRKGDKGVVRV